MINFLVNILLSLCSFVLFFSPKAAGALEVRQYLLDIPTYPQEGYIVLQPLSPESWVDGWSVPGEEETAARAAYEAGYRYQAAVLRTSDSLAGKKYPTEVDNEFTFRTVIAIGEKMNEICSGPFATDEDRYYANGRAAACDACFGWYGRQLEAANEANYFWEENVRTNFFNMALRIFGII